MFGIKRQVGSASFQNAQTPIDLTASGRCRGPRPFPAARRARPGDRPASWMSDSIHDMSKSPHSYQCDRIRRATRPVSRTDDGWRFIVSESPARLRPLREQLMPLWPESRSRSASRRPGSATIASSRFRNPVRHAIDRRRLEQSVLYSIATQSRSPSRRSSSSGRRARSADRARSTRHRARAGSAVRRNAQRKRGETLVIETLGFLMGEHHLEQQAAGWDRGSPEAG